MKKLLIITIIAFNAIIISAQTQKYDIMTYTPPKGWTAQNGDNAKVFTKIDKAKNTLGIIMLYPSINSSGDANDDFKYVWKQIVQDSFGASGKPETEIVENDGFKIVNGGELIKYEGIQALAMLTVLSGKGKVVSILTITNDESYVQSTQAMIEGMTIEAKETAKIPPSSPNSSESTSFSGSVGDYNFTTPKGWTRRNQTDEITLHKDNNQFVISFLPTATTSGNLEADANRILFEQFKGWVAWDKNGFKPDFAEFEKGKTIQGLNYFLLKKMLRKANDDYTRIESVILLVQFGNKIAVIIGVEPFQSIGRDTSNALDNILYDLSINNAGTNASLQKELLGSWSSISSVALLYTYHPNNTFSFGGAYQTRTSRDTYTDNVTTTTFSADGSYSLVGNLLTTTHKRTKVISKSKIRFYYTKYDKDEWIYKMGSLSMDRDASGGSIEYKRDKN